MLYKSLSLYFLQNYMQKQFRQHLPNWYMPDEPREVHNVETMEDVYSLECIKRASNYSGFCKWAISPEQMSPYLMILCDPDPKTGLPLKFYVAGTLVGFTASETELEDYTKLIAERQERQR